MTPDRASGEPRRLVDQVIEVAVYVPLGAALRLAEQVPELSAAGRAVAGRQVDNARVVGRFAVGTLRREVERRIGHRPGAGPVKPAPSPAPGPAPAPPAGDEAAGGEAGGGEAGGQDPTSPEREARGRRGRPGRAGPEAPGSPGPPAAAEALAVPGYDALAASQVIPLLSGLSEGELEAVRLHEAGGRARRTVLGRIAQLQQERADERRRRG